MKKNRIDGEETKAPLGALLPGMPRHVAIIMDGNGRWAKRRLMPRSYGHRQGLNRMIGLLEHAYDLGIPYVTVYALSTENLKRPKEELEGLYDLIRKHFAEYMKKIIERGVRVRILGDLALLPADVGEIVKRAEADSAGYSGKGLNVALAYGSRSEIVRAANIAVSRGQQLTEESLSALLYTGGLPDPDLVIRTGKEKRISNFLLYQAAYAEFYFSDKMFPEFSDEDFDEALKDFKRRVRRFGKTDEQL